MGQRASLCSTLECDDWQMSAAILEIDFQRESITWLSAMSVLGAAHGEQRAGGTTLIRGFAAAPARTEHLALEGLGR